MFKPYDTTYGSLINLKKIDDKLLKYINTVELEDLEYEYPTATNKVTAIYVTGYNLEEQELPLWDHPIVLQTLKDETVIVNDVRKYVKTKDTLEVALEDIVKDKSGLSFILVRSAMLQVFLDNDLNEHNVLINPAATAMGVWISGIVNSVVSLTPLELFNVEITSSIYGNTLFYKPEDVKDNIDQIRARVINSKHIYKLNKSAIHEVVKKYDFQLTGLEALIYNIGNVIDFDKARLIDVNVLVGALGNVWYGPGGSETPIMALENMPTWLALLHAVITNRSYAKSRIGMILNKHKKVIDTVLIERHITNMLKNEL